MARPRARREVAVHVGKRPRQVGNGADLAKNRRAFVTILLKLPQPPALAGGFLRSGRGRIDETVPHRGNFPLGTVFAYPTNHRSFTK